MKPGPFRIEPTFSPRIWGARTLAPIFLDKTALPEPIGEAWLTDVQCRIANGPFAGKTLGEAWAGMPAEWRGERFRDSRDFPILVKFIFPNDKLSIQVHPDDAYAALHEQAAGGRGKTEMWHVVSAEPHAKVLVGLRPHVDKEAFLQGLAAHQLEDLFESQVVRAGDTLFVPAGTPHTIGPGMVLYEVQEYSDLTYRVYDYERLDPTGQPRQLHLEKALEVIKFGSPAPGAFKTDQPMDEKGSAHVEYLAACRYFAAERWEVQGSAKEKTNPGQFELLTFLDGAGAIRCDRRDYDCSTGETWFLPANLGEYIFSPTATILRTYVPDMAAFSKTFVDKGYSEEQRRRFIFG